MGLYVLRQTVDLVYADMLYDDTNFSWILSAIELLKPNGSMFVQTDYRSVAKLKLYADEVFAEYGGWMNNWIIWPYDWGGRPQDAFGRKHDDILWYVKGPGYKFYPKRVGIPKKTASSIGLNPSGRDWKIPTDVWSDIGNFLTTDPERIRDPETGIGIKWQKPERLVRRIVLATTDKGDLVLDPFLGTGTTGAVCYKSKRRFVGFDINPVMINISVERLNRIRKNK